MKEEQKANTTYIEKYTAQKCPVCNGWGTVSYKRIACHACGGKGYILIPREKKNR